MNPKRLASFFWATLVIPALALSSGRAFAADPQGNADNQDALRTAVVLSFLHQANLRESAMAGIARARSDSQAITSFARLLVVDHNAMDQVIQDFANRRGINMDAAAEQVKRDVEQTMQDRGVKSVGSATGEWAFTAEPGIDPQIAHLAMTNFQTSLEKLATLSGTALDREFIQAVMNDHQLVIDRVTSAGKRIKDPEVSALVGKLLAMDRDHLVMAQRLRERVARP